MPTLTSRDSKSSCVLMPHCQSFDLVDSGGVYSNLRWSNAAPIFTGGNFTLVTVSRPKLVTNDFSTGGGFNTAGFRYYTNHKFVANLDGYAKPRHAVYTSSEAVTPGNVLRNQSNDKWQFSAIGLKDNGVNFFGFNDGIYVSSATPAARTAGILNFGIPAFTTDGTGNTDFDNSVTPNGLPQSKVALVLAFSKALSTQELLDLYGMIMLGKGYAISPASVGAYWLARPERKLPILSTDSGTDYAAFASAHGLANAQLVTYFAKNPVGNSVGGLQSGATYYVFVQDATHVSFHKNATEAGTGANKINIDNILEGTHELVTREALPAYAPLTSRGIISDLSGNNLNANLYSNKTAWADIMDVGTPESNPAIYVPKEWTDYPSELSIIVNPVGSTVIGR